MDRICLTSKDVALALNIGANAAYNLWHRDGIPAIRVWQRRIVIPAEVFRRWLNRQADRHSGETDTQTARR